jgi:hypothetical protein
MRHYHGDDGHLVEVDTQSPDVLLARKEELHFSDGDDWDAAFAPDDMAETATLAGVRDIPRGALKSLLRFIIPQPGRMGAKRWDVATVRLALLARMVDLDNLSELSLAQLGEELGVTRSLLSLRSLEIVDSLELNKDLLGKQRASRESYRKSAIASHRARGHRMTQDGELTVSASE